MEMEAAAILCQRSIKEGTGLRSKVKERRCKAVSIGGETVGSLKETAIVKLTNFYRNAIKDNCNDVEKMKRAIYATLYHCSSTDAKPKHNKCTNAKRSWCFFKRAFANGKSSENHSVMKTKLTEEVVAKILLVYQRLASNEILSRCTSESHWEHQDSSLVTMDFKKLGSFSPSVQLSLLIAFSSEDKVCGTDSAHIFVLPKHSCKDESQEPADFRQENAQTFDLAWFDCTATMSADSGAPNDKTGYMSDIMCAEILTTRGRWFSSILSNQPRLPELTLESFRARISVVFPVFWARFKSAVHENSSLNDVDKFSYLKSVVTSDAELAIRGLTLTSENYAKAIKILENRFGQKSKQKLHLDLEEKNVDVKTTSSNSVFHNRGGVLLQCVKAEIIGRSSSDKVFCLFDIGSEKSFIKKMCLVGWG
ncbi:uncharacterized protein TNCV_1466781 [Trichonephila clavipes]|nr:uncharacterized protein TNCV_1466781 [Trichonephila clavipes]